MSRRDAMHRSPDSDNATTRRTAVQPKTVVRAGLRRDGEPLDTAVRSDMEGRFGRSFGHVRVHTDPEAGASALALGASAYTTGRDIVFSPGAWQPQTGAGRGLLVHELAHVGDTPEQTAAPERVSHPRSRGEAEAARTADAVLGGGPVPPAHAAASEPGVAHRSLLGGLAGGALGGLIGGVGLGLLGSLLGPAGAVAGAIIGGLAGFVGGAILGDMASRRERGLTQPEKDYAKEIYHESVDLDAVRITRGSMLSAGAARTTGNTINLQDEHFKGDTMELSDAGTLVLIHELGHVWQYQNGGLSYIPSSLIPQIVAATTGQSRNAAYDWRSAARNHIEWSDWNAEQQAECISDYNEALRRINAGTNTLEDYDTVSLAEPYIELVRERIGAPGSNRRRREAQSAGSAAPAGSPS